MEAIFGSIVVDPFVFYAVLTGIALVLAVLIVLMVKSKMRRRNVVLEPIIVEEQKTVEPATLVEEKAVDISNINKEPVNKPDDISNMLKTMEATVNTPKEKDPIDTFERLQEEKAIISYKELVEAKNKQTFISDEEPIETVNIDLTPNQEDLVRRFKTSDVISPVFGKIDENTVYPEMKPLEKPIKHEELVKEPIKQVSKVNPNIKEGEDFLSALKDFRKNLE